MTRIAGVKMIRNATGKVTHVTLSVRHHREYLEDMLDGLEMAKARKGKFVPWEDAKKRIEKKFELGMKPKEKK